MGQSGQRQLETEFDLRQARDVVLIDTSVDLASSRGFDDALSDDLLRISAAEHAVVLVTLEPVLIAPVRGRSPETEGLTTVLGVDPATLKASEATMTAPPPWKTAECGRREGLIGRDAAEAIGVSPSASRQSPNRRGH